ncbi:ATP-binding cassette domain-containing protein [Olivibacter ginsenosidimutans]|uniref:ATP-binding cassette domain-containing protein n=1 Tax=Olivibacter ginsenosidimutans TaxID=1176537 RepID=A0ABP9AFI3_9SPHI
MSDYRELYLDSVSHRYGTKQILSSVYLSCKIGETVGLLGRNGSGKSTLLKVIFGTLNPHFKYARLNGKPFKKGYLTGQIAYLPQERFVPLHVKIEKLFHLFVHTHRDLVFSTDFIRDHLRYTADQLSGGLQRLIECFLILYSDASFVLLDEPFSQIAPIYVEEIQDHMQLLKAKKGFIVTDHYYERILEVSDRIVLINNGCNYKITTKEDLALHGYIPSMK